MSRRPSRRRFLAGIGGAMVALPALESVRWLSKSGEATAAVGDSPVYSVFVRQGNGVQQGLASRDEPDRFWPQNHGVLTPEILGVDNADRALSELSEYANSLLVVSGTRYGFPGEGCSHSGGLNQCLTAARVTGAGKDSLSTGESVDWFLSQRVNQGGAEPLNLMSGPQNAYIAHGLSYSGPQELRGAVNNPFQIYTNLVGLTGASQEVLEAIALRRRSVNDLVREEMQDLLSKNYLSTSDRQRLNTHFESIRDIEVGLSQQLTDSEVQAMEDIAGASADNGNRLIVAEMMMDIIALAFASDLNRVATLQIGTGNDATRYTVNGQLQNTFHRISHRVDSDGGDGPVIPNADLLHHEIDRMFARSFKHLLDRLSLYTSTTGKSLLDDTVAVWTNDLSNGPPHSYSNLPQVIAGQGGGFLKTGQYIDAGDVTNNKLLNTLINAAGVRNEDGSLYDSFGDASLERGVIADMISDT